MNVSHSIHSFSLASFQMFSIFFCARVYPFNFHVIPRRRLNDDENFMSWKIAGFLLAFTMTWNSFSLFHPDSCSANKRQSEWNSECVSHSKIKFNDAQAKHKMVLKFWYEPYYFQVYSAAFCFKNILKYRSSFFMWHTTSAHLYSYRSATTLILNCSFSSHRIHKTDVIF